MVLLYFFKTEMLTKNHKYSTIKTVNDHQPSLTISIRMQNFFDSDVIWKLKYFTQTGIVGSITQNLYDC